MKQYLTLDEAADYLGITTRALNKMVRDREIACYEPTPRRRYFALSDIEAYLTRGGKIEAVTF